MEIWVVERRYEGFEGAFSSKELAKEYVKRQTMDSFIVKKITVDKPIDSKTPTIILKAGTQN